PEEQPQPQPEPIVDSGDAALARDLQAQEDEEDEVAASGVGSSRMAVRRSTRQPRAAVSVAVAAAEASSSAKGKGKASAKTKTKKKKDDSEPEDASDDDSDDGAGLNRSSARKGGRMKDCEVCERRFLVRAAPPAGVRLLCANCQRSADRTRREAAAIAKRSAHAAAPAAPKRRRLKKTADGLLELEAGLATLQDLCVRAIARHVDQVDSFGDVSAQSLDRLCRIVSKLRVLDERTLALFLGADRSSVVLYDCTRLAREALARIVDLAPNVQTLALEYCGRLDGGVLGAFGAGLAQLARVRLDGAFLVADAAWARFFRDAGPRLRSFHVRFAGFGAAAMRALATHCERLEDLRVSECTDFGDDCLAMLAAPLTETEEALQEPERLLRDAPTTGAGEALKEPERLLRDAPLAIRSPPLAVAAWRPLAHLHGLDLARPHLPMASATATRVVATLGSALRTLDLSGFKDIDDAFLQRGLALLASSQHLRELGLAECNSISAPALAQFFAQGAATTLGRGLERLSLGRCYMLTDAVIEAVVRHSGCSLRSLDLNSVDDHLSEEGLLALAGCPHLEDVDLSWVRCTSDAVLEKVLGGCGRLAKITVYGCPEVTIFAPTRRGLQYVGRVCDTL
ncbi:UV-damaged DNA-binding protein rad7, partial [Coemansia sp. RSA 2424]